jgi:hypothetical protein
MIFGDYGVGKTWLLGSADDVPEMRDVLFLDVESGDLVLESRPYLDVVRVSQYKQVQGIYEFLRLHQVARDAGDEQQLRELQDRIDLEDVVDKDRLRRYRTVVIDSLSELQRLNMYQIMGTTLGARALVNEPEKAEWADWGATTEMIRTFVRTFRDLKMHILFGMSEKSVDDKNKKASIQLNLPKKLSEDLPGFMDVVGYLMAMPKEKAKDAKKVSSDGLYRELWLVPGQGFLAKNRFENFREPYVANPTMAQLYGFVRNPEDVYQAPTGEVVQSRANDESGKGA